jgi:hypothetical protein
MGLGAEAQLARAFVSITGAKNANVRTFYSRAASHANHSRIARYFIFSSCTIHVYRQVISSSRSLADTTRSRVSD